MAGVSRLVQQLGPTQRLDLKFVVLIGCWIMLMLIAASFVMYRLHQSRFPLDTPVFVSDRISVSMYMNDTEQETPSV